MPTRLALALVAALLASCASHPNDNDNEPQPQNWHKGNTHAHTVLCGHADSQPEAVAQWYLDHEFNFLILSEHNIYIEPESVALPEDRREDFILIPGEEISGHKTIHTTGMNLDGLVDASFDSEHKSEIIQNHTDGAIAAGGVAILNHPNFGWAVSPEDMLPVERLHMFELYNGHPSVRNLGDDEHVSTEALWDILLGAGKVIYGVSSDDMHKLEEWGPNVSNPGRGFVMVDAPALDADAITEAMKRGEFYSSSGIILERVSAGEPGHAYSGDSYEVVVDEAATMKELESRLLVPNRVHEATEGFRMEWISQGGKVLSSVGASSSVMKVEADMLYLRCKVTYARKVEAPEGEPGFEEFYAWTQPIFTDDRRERLMGEVATVAAGHTHEGDADDDHRH